MKKIAIFLGLYILLCGFTAVQAEDSMETQVNAQAVYNPNITSESYSASYAYPASLPILPEGAGCRAIPNSQVELMRMDNFPYFPLDILSPRPTGLNPFSKPYQKSILCKEEPNNNPIRVLSILPKNARKLGTIRIQDYGDYAPLEVIKQALYYCKKFTNTSNVAILRRQIPIAKSNSKGLGGSSVSAGLHDKYKEALTVSGSGLWSNSKGWVDYGVEIIAICYEDLPDYVGTIPYGRTNEARIKNLAEEMMNNFGRNRKIYFISYRLQNESKQKALARAKITAKKLAQYTNPDLIPEFQLIAPSYTPNGTNVQEHKIVDLVVANRGFTVKENPHIQKTGKE